MEMYLFTQNLYILSAGAPVFRLIDLSNYDKNFGNPTWRAKWLSILMNVIINIKHNWFVFCIDSPITTNYPLLHLSLVLAFDKVSEIER